MVETEMMERVAMGIWHARAKHFGEAPKPFVKDERWELCLSYARAAFEAARKPTADIVAASDSPFPSYYSGFNKDDAAEVWTAMVDKALHPSTVPTPRQPG